MMGRLISFGLLLLLLGCGGGSPTHFFTLAPVGPSEPRSVRPGLVVAVGHVMLPPALDRDAIVTQSGPERLDVSSQNRWAAPLDSIVQRVLAADLTSRLPNVTVLSPGDPMPSGHVLTVDVNIRQFISGTDGVVLDADWSVTGVVRMQHVSLTRQAESGDAGAVTAAMSQLLGELSDRIAASVN